MKTNFFLILFYSLLMTGYSFAEVYIPVGEAKIKKSVLAFPQTKLLEGKEGALKGLSVTVRDTILHDLEFTTLFQIQNESAFIEKPDAGMTLETFNIMDWATISSEFLVKTSISLKGDSVEYEMRLFDVVGKKQIFGKKYVSKVNEPLILAHTVANEIMEALTGRPGIFFSKIAMVCDKGGSKEIWVMDFDGSNPKQITRHKSLAFAPAWSPDNKKLVYSLVTKNKKNIKNIDLYEYHFGSQTSKLLSNRQGINSGAVYHPDGKRLALTMSFLGDPQIFSLNVSTKQVTSIVKSLGVDVDPDFSPDGKKLAFVSSRSNQPMVYISDADGKNPERITFAGEYNATPRWHPSGKKLVFAGYLEKRFDLFLINADKTGLERLTKNEGNNEDPDFSPDGGFIAFNSNRAGQKNVYIVTIDGLTTKRLTYGLGDCVAPRWSN